MKKSLTKLLARMAKDGDVEAVAEFIEEMIEGEPETKAEAAAEAVEEVTEAVAGAVAGAIAPEGTEVTVDEDTISGIIERLDRLIELLTPAPAAADEDPEDPEETCGADALRAALNAAAPRLAKMSRKQRRKAAADIAARVQKTRRKGANRGYDRVTKPRPAKDSGNAYNVLGKRIMAARNANYHK